VYSSRNPVQLCTSNGRSAISTSGSNRTGLARNPDLRIEQRRGRDEIVLTPLDARPRRGGGELIEHRGGVGI